jgi:hypothetical protein
MSACTPSQHGARAHRAERRAGACCRQSIKFTGELEPDHHYPPLLGADNRLILSRLLGLTDERIDGLEGEGAFGDKRKTLAVR